MKYFAPLFLCLLLISSAQSQTLAEKVAVHACTYLDSVVNFETLQDSIKPSITAAMARVVLGGTPEERKKVGSVEGITGLIIESNRLLPSCCYNVRRLIIEDKTTRFYKRSQNNKANEHFDKGNDLMEISEYKKAIGEFEKAIKLDKNFVFALDHLAISYRRLNDHRSAIKHYKRSLAIFPEGEIALLNSAVSYSYLKENDNATECYKQLKYLYPNKPEGYFGLARAQFIAQDYENALDNLFISHVMYVESGSEYVNDSKQLLGLMVSKLKELNRMDLVSKKAQEHNISIE